MARSQCGFTWKSFSLLCKHWTDAWISFFSPIGPKVVIRPHIPCKVKLWFLLPNVIFIWVCLKWGLVLENQSYSWNVISIIWFSLRMRNCFWYVAYMDLCLGFYFGLTWSGLRTFMEVNICHFSYTKWNSQFAKGYQPSILLTLYYRALITPSFWHTSYGEEQSFYWKLKLKQEKFFK